MIYIILGGLVLLVLVTAGRRGQPIRIRREWRFISGAGAVVALIAAALEPSLFSDVVIRRGIPSLRYLLDKPVKYQEAPDLFCLDLYKFTDLDRLAALAAPSVVKSAD